MTDFDARIPYSTMQKVKRTAYTKLEDIAFDHQGIIYGGYVRDTLIHDEFSERFHRLFPDDLLPTQGKYWDKSFSPDTAKRLIVPNDMDVCFYTEASVDSFIADVKKVPEFSKLYMSDVTHIKYYSTKIERIKHLCIHLTIGRIPFIDDGATVIIAVDVILRKQNTCCEPPFNNLDMLCNGFIKTKDGVRLSKNTGTVIDRYTEFERIQVATGIMRDAINGKTHLCFSKNCIADEASVNFNLNAMQRISKMHKMGWEFLNAPFKTDVFRDNEDTTTCCICQSDFTEGDKVSYTVSEKNGIEIPCAKMHSACFMKYLNHQRFQYLADMPWHTTGTFVFHCPYHNNVDFRQCIHTIQGLYLPPA